MNAKTLHYYRNARKAGHPAQGALERARFLAEFYDGEDPDGWHSFLGGRVKAGLVEDSEGFDIENFEEGTQKILRKLESGEWSVFGAVAHIYNEDGRITDKYADSLWGLVGRWNDPYFLDCVFDAAEEAVRMVQAEAYEVLPL